MQTIVQKFGGSSLADENRLNCVAKIITEKHKENNIVVVVSAQGDFTDELIKKSKKVNKTQKKREIDVLLSSGEQISASLMVMAIEKLGFSAISLLGWQIPIYTDNNNTIAKIKKISKERIIEELNKRKIVVVAGFQGINDNKDITTLGRGGSDTTAVALSVILNAECEIYTDVNGVYTADPRIIKNARKLKDIGYDEMLELASAGAKVLHNRSVEMAKKYSVVIKVKSSFENSEGTSIKGEDNLEKMLIRGVAHDNDVALISLLDVKNEKDVIFNLFTLLAKKQISVDIIVQTKRDEELIDISFTVTKDKSEEAIEVLKSNSSLIKFKNITENKNVAKISIVGSAMITNSGVASKMFEALYEKDIEVLLITTSEIKLAVLVKEEDAKEAAKAIHSNFFV